MSKKPVKEKKKTAAVKVAEKAVKGAKAREKADKKGDERKGRVHAVALETMTGDVLKTVVEIIKDVDFENGFRKLSESKQREKINLIRETIKESIGQVVRLVAADERVTCVATLNKIVIQDGIKLDISIAKRDENRHGVFEAQGKEILIIVADSKDYHGEKDVPQPEKDQPDMLEGKGITGKQLAEHLQKQEEDDEAEVQNPESAANDDDDHASTVSEEGDEEDEAED